MNSMPNRIVKGDLVVVTTGKDKGKQGRVLQVIPKKERLRVEGINVVKRHLKASEGGIVEKEAPLHLSNVMLIDPQDGRPTRVGFEKTDKGWKRISRRSKEEIPFPSSES